MGLVPLLVEVEPRLRLEELGVELVLQREARRVGVLGVVLGSELARVAQRREGDEEPDSTSTYVQEQRARLDDARAGLGL